MILIPLILIDFILSFTVFYAALNYFAPKFGGIFGAILVMLAIVIGRHFIAKAIQNETRARVLEALSKAQTYDDFKKYVDSLKEDK